MSGVQWRWFLDGAAVAHLGLRADRQPSAVTACGADGVEEVGPYEVAAASRCERCAEVHDDLAAVGQLRAWRERGLVYTSQRAPDVVAVYVGALTINVWRHPDGALIEAVDADDRRHAACVSICRDPEEAGGRAVILAISHGPQCAERPMWPVMDADARAVGSAQE